MKTGDPLKLNKNSNEFTKYIKKSSFKKYDNKAKNELPYRCHIKLSSLSFFYSIFPDNPKTYREKLSFRICL